MDEGYLSKKELAAKLGVSQSTITRHVRPQLRVGGQNRYLLSEVERQLRGIEERDNVVLLRKEAA